MDAWSFVGRSVLCISLLAWALWSDLSKREVENWLPISLVVGGIGFAAADAAVSESLIPLVLCGLSGFFGFAIALAIFYSGSMGGADCKVFIGISTVFPLTLDSPLPLLSSINPFVSSGARVLPMFSLSWLVNSLIVSMAVPIGLAVKNLSDYLRGRIPNASIRSIPAFFVGYRAKVRSLRPSFVIPMERFEDTGDGFRRVLRYTRRILEEEEEERLISEVKRRLGDEEEVWAFPYVPFMAPMFIAFLVTLFFGDIVVSVAMSL